MAPGVLEERSTAHRGLPAEACARSATDRRLRGNGTRSEVLPRRTPSKTLIEFDVGTASLYGQGLFGCADGARGWRTRSRFRRSPSVDFANKSSPSWAYPRKMPA